MSKKVNLNQLDEETSLLPLPLEVPTNSWLSTAEFLKPYKVAVGVE